MAHGARIVAMGGGTGLPVILKGLREYVRSGLPGAERIDLGRVSAIVSVSDDGGSSGRLMVEFDTLPPGDVRNCLLALTDDDEASLLKTFLGYRFRADEAGGLEGHSVGNLLITALARLNGNDFRRAISDVARILNLKGRILLPTLERHTLAAELDDGSLIRGESRIRLRWNPSPIRRVLLEHLPGGGGAGEFTAEPEALEAIRSADVILLGPGSLFTSVIPSFLVPEVTAALVERSLVVPVFYICNLMTEAGETDRFGVGDHVKALLSHAPGLRVAYCVANRQPISADVLLRYSTERFFVGYHTVAAALGELEEWHRAAAVPPATLAEHAEAHATRLRILADEMRQLVEETVLVKPDPARDAGCGAEIVDVDAVREVEIMDVDTRKRVIRHHAVHVLQAIFERM